MHDRAEDQRAEQAGVPSGEGQYYSGEHMQLLAQMAALRRDARGRRN